MKNEKGISLIETLIVATLMLVVLGSAFSLIIHFGNAQKTELARTRLSEESRFMFNTFAEQLKEAGAVLTLAHSNLFLRNTPYFNGIFPLDKTDGPDGIIIATGDPNGVTMLTANYTPTSGSPIPVSSTLKKDGTSAWATGDRGILIATNGYYVFSITAATADTLSVRGDAVYYSGLLQNCGTYKYSDPSPVKGNTITYSGNTSPSAAKTPVIRLANFSIILFDNVEDKRLKRNVNRMYSINDTVGGNNVLTDNAIVSDYIYDMQLSYICYTDLTNAALNTTSTFFDATTPTTVETVYSSIQNKLLKEINATVVVLTDEFGGTGKRTLTIPAIKNRNSYTLPTGKYGFKIYSYLIQNKNFNIVI